MRIMKSDDLRDRLGLGNLQVFITAADNATLEARTAIEADIRSPLVHATYQDIYFLQVVDLTSHSLKFKTTAGFIDRDSLQIGTGLTSAEAAADTSLTEAATVFAEKGLILLTNAMIMQFISVRYDAGFSALSAPDDDVLDLTAAPEWLQIAGQVKSIALIAEDPELQNKEGKIVDPTAYKKQYTGQIEGKIRYEPGARTPIG